MSTIRDIGEFGLIERLQKFLPAVNPADLVLGIGDDCAVIRISDDRNLVVTVDMQVDGIHFRSSRGDWYAIGRRAMSVNLSDLAAMGATPRFALISLGLPPTMASDNFDALYRGLSERITEFGGVVIGGNLAGTSDQVVIDIFLMGEVSPHQMLLRSSAKVGDAIYVTGNLGSAAAGLFLMELPPSTTTADDLTPFAELIRAHTDPTPRIAFAQALAASGLATAALDLSDGLAGDLGHLCSASQCGALLESSALPHHESLPAALHYLEEHGDTKHTLESLLLQGGEEYELLFTVRAESDLAQLHQLAQSSGIKITRIGTMVSGSDLTLQYPSGDCTKISASGWDHFR